MENEDVVPIAMLFLVGIVLTLVGISFGFRAWSSPLWLYCPGLMGMGIPMLIIGLLMIMGRIQWK